MTSHERYCEEEVQLAEQWVLWAVGKRDECALISSDIADQSLCLQAHIQQLDVIEKEYAEVYQSQMRNLRQDHPVAATIMRRLQSHKAMASAILQQHDATPEGLAASLRRSCLNDARNPRVSR